MTPPVTQGRSLILSAVRLLPALAWPSRFLLQVFSKTFRLGLCKWGKSCYNGSGPDVAPFSLPSAVAALGTAALGMAAQSKNRLDGGCPWRLCGARDRASNRRTKNRQPGKPKNRKNAGKRRPPRRRGRGLALAAHRPSVTKGKKQRERHFATTEEPGYAGVHLPALLELEQRAGRR